MDMKADDADQEKENASRVLAFKAIRCFYMALSYSNGSQWSKAMALFERYIWKKFAFLSNFRANEQMTIALEHYAKCKNVPLNTINSLHDTALRIQSCKAEARAKAFLEQLKRNQVQKEEQKPTTEATTAGSNRSLLNGLSEFDSSYATSKQLIPFPPNFEPIKCKPVLFDLALLDCTFPNLDARKQAPKQQLKSGIWGWFGGGSK